MGYLLDIKLRNAVYEFQYLSGKTGFKSVSKNRPCCIADNGIVLGVNDACDKFNICAAEPLNEALLKCADLCNEEPKFDVLKKYSVKFFDICSRFGLVNALAFDECLLEVDDVEITDIYSCMLDIEEALKSELGTDSFVEVVDNSEQNINPYSASADWSAFAIQQLAAELHLKLSVDNAGAKMFSVQVSDCDGFIRTIDRRVELPFNDFDMICFIIRNMLDGETNVSRITVNLYDIHLNREEAKTSPKIDSVAKKYRKKPPWQYQKYNDLLTKTINANKLYVYDNLAEYLKYNPDNFDFDKLCAIAEKSNTRRLKLGSYYLSADYAEKFVSLCEAQKSNHIKVLINGYIPFVLLYHIKEVCRADFYYTNLDSRTVNLIEKLDALSPYPLLDLKPADSIDYDFIISGTPDVQYKSKYKVFIVRKSFFASAEKDAVAKNKIVQIFDFGEHGINGTYDQFVAILTDESQSPDTTEVLDLEDNYSVIQNQKYITDDKLPCWVLYRNDKFDSIYSKLEFNIFNVCTSNKIKQSDYNPRGDIRVISSACIDSERNVNVDEKCKFAQSKDIDKYDVFEYANRDDVFFASANGTALKIARKPKGCVPNPSTVLLVPKGDVAITEKDIEFLSSPEFKSFYDVALNHQCFTLSSGSISQYFLGKTVASA
ncbi:MAG: hypothetical protein IJ643_04940 [Eubacterium sp.]|nr:hypothetical protein [Eubacterium sp.]